MDFTWPAELRELQQRAHAFADRWTRGRPVLEDSWLVGSDREVDEALAAEGWIGMTWPIEAGGRGRPEIERFAVVEVLLSRGVPVAGSWFADRQIGPVLLQFGSEEQRGRWLPGIVAGRSRWCIGMSEPGAGSDVASIATRADRDGEWFVVNGSKVWTSGAASADWCYLICRTAVTERRHEGLSDLVVDMASPGVTVRPIKDASGAEDFCEVFFDDVRVPVSNLVGALHGSFRQSMRQLEHERGGVDRLVSNRAVYEWARARADTSDPLVRDEIARLETAYRIGRTMVLRNVVGDAPAGSSAITKTFCTEHEQRVAAFVARVAGPAALVAGRPSRAVVYARAYTLMGGTTEILRNVIAERVLGLPR